MASILPCLSEGKEGIRLKVLAVPKSSRTQVVDLLEDKCKIKVKAPPVEGKANKVLLNALAKLFKLPKKAVVLDKGSAGRNKVFILKEISLEKASSVLDKILSAKAG
ncbi:MAG: DUF167 domain-containing protein [Candidatus Rifleibacteriota bacterium]